MENVGALRREQPPQGCDLEQGGEAFAVHRSLEVPRAGALELGDEPAAVRDDQRLVALGDEPAGHLQRAALHAAGIQLGQDLQDFHREISGANHAATMRSAQRPASCSAGPEASAPAPAASQFS